MSKKWLILIILALFILPSANAWWFEKKYTSDNIYCKMGDLSGVVETTSDFKINITGNVYLKVVGDDYSPWLIDGSGWYLDLYLRPDLSSDWIQVASHVNNPNPSQEVRVQAFTTAEMKAVVYYPTVIETQLSEDLLPDDASMKCDDVSSFPISGVVKIEDEYIKYNSKNDTSFSGLAHGDFGSVAVHHPKGTKVSLYSGTFHIPIIIAINTTGGGGSGGAMHPSRCHSLNINIAVGKSPVALFTYTAWYNDVTVNASKSYDPDGQIVSYQWDFDDDGMYDDMGVVAEYVYNETGFHRITLKVTDNDGMSTTYSQIVNIRNMMPNPSEHWYMQKFWILRVWQWIIVVIVVAIIVKKL